MAVLTAARTAAADLLFEIVNRIAQILSKSYGRTDAQEWFESNGFNMSLASVIRGKALLEVSDFKRALKESRSQLGEIASLQISGPRQQDDHKIIECKTWVARLKYPSQRRRQEA